MEPIYRERQRFERNGLFWEVREILFKPDGIYYLAVPYESAAKELNFDPIVVKESEIV